MNHGKRTINKARICIMTIAYIYRMLIEQLKTFELLRKCIIKLISLNVQFVTIYLVFDFFCTRTFEVSGNFSNSGISGNGQIDKRLFRDFKLWYVRICRSLGIYFDFCMAMGYRASSLEINRRRKVHVSNIKFIDAIRSIVNRDITIMQNALTSSW